ncbi:MAG: nuclear transport factor 2 family protein [Myxococcales bacterium]|nr:nuclear transport factor 2 family protein [Myxococcales bacterium]MCB9628651.1 nuclear transport factor 2 family protein [Sandaracinaceae bacterium]
MMRPAPSSPSSMLARAFAMAPSMPLSRTALLVRGVLLAALAAGGCTRDIPNTTVPDTAANREVIEFMESYRNALEDRDVRALTAMASPRYLDMSGTPSGEDDVDYDTLAATLPELFARVEDVRFEIRYRHVVFREEDVLVEFRYTASWLIADHRGENEWHHKVEDKRMVLEWDSENGRYLILSGM